MQLEERYIVLKKKDVQAALSPVQQAELQTLCSLIDIERSKHNKPFMQAVVIEKDWPEYVPTVKRLLSRMASGGVVKHSHYHKDVSHLNRIDVYRVLERFGVTNQAIGHAIKKLLVAGGRGAGKGLVQDFKEAVDSINRAIQIIEEDAE